MSGGYRDNEDMGERFVYTGAGGQDKGNKQVRSADGRKCTKYARNQSIGLLRVLYGPVKAHWPGTPVGPWQGDKQVCKVIILTRSASKRQSEACAAMVVS
jgi:hypothetical protein